MCTNGTQVTVQLTAASVCRAVSVLAVPALVLLYHINSSWSMLAFVAVVYGPVLWLTVLLHEVGHCVVTNRVRAVPPVTHTQQSTASASLLWEHDQEEANAIGNLGIIRT